MTYGMGVGCGLSRSQAHGAKTRFHREAVETGRQKGILAILQTSRFHCDFRRSWPPARQQEARGRLSGHHGGHQLGEPDDIQQRGFPSIPG